VFVVIFVPPALKESHTSEAQLIKDCISGQRVAQEKMYKSYYPIMMPICMSYLKDTHLAVEIYNTGMLKVFQSLSNYKGKGALGAWIRRILVHTCIDHLRSNLKFKNHVEIESVFSISVKPSVVSSICTEEIVAVFHSLPDTYRTVAVLNIIEGYTHKEISEKLDISIGTSKWYLSESRKMLQMKLHALGINLESV
jgi:RNA polymerase sigma-70 factor (ECF subfamily)